MKDGETYSAIFIVVTDNETAAASSTKNRESLAFPFRRNFSGRWERTLNVLHYADSLCTKEIR